ncbi:hypothetical protein [Thermococcus sp.]
MRRAQVFTLDALLSMVLVIMVLGVVLNTSESITTEITNLAGWYERANFANNMLDVLTKSPGDPENWELNISALKSVGLRSSAYSYADDYIKLITLVRNANLPVVRDSLLNLSSWKDFQLNIYLTNISVELNVVSTSPVNVQVVNVSYVYASNLSKPTFNITFINGSLVTNENIINSSKLNAKWILYQHKNIILARRIYYGQVNISKHCEVLSGILKNNVPPYSRLEIDVPSDENGYVIFSVLDGNQGKALVIQKESATSNVNATIVTENNTLTYVGNLTTVVIPWSSLFEEFNSENTVKIVDIWVYDDTFTGTVTMRDLNALGVILAPRLEPAILKLWVWGS